MKVTYNEAAKELIEKGTKKLESLNFTPRFYSHDASLWKTDPDAVKIINNSLGWSEVYDWTLNALPEVISFAQEAKKDYKHVVLMGMGGSSLAPEVFRVLFGKQEGWPELIVLDSTNPDWIASVRAKIVPSKTLFIFASKSGGTVEPSSQFAYFYDEVSKESKNPGHNFIAITDPGTGLQTIAKEHNFRKVFTNRADIGGRFSALSLFGIVPAALCGIDVKKLLEETKKQGEAFKAGSDKAAFELGALMGAGYGAGKDKLTLVMPKNVGTFGLWVEQLVAESTGKEGKGIVPVAGEGLYRNFDYKDDRIFVCISFDCKDNDRVKEITSELAKTKHPVFEVQMCSLYALGAQFLLWEIATAASGAILEINPFDQPNVQLAKTITKGLLADLASGKKSEETSAELLLSDNLKGKVSLSSLASDLIALPKGKDYIALLAYMHNSKENDAVLSCLRDEIFTRTKRAVLFGYGPRYLHSTGQLHKGDGNNGIFIIISADAEQDVKIPAQAYSFADLVNAQALADFKALREKGRRVIKIHLKKPVLNSLKKISSLF